MKRSTFFLITVILVFGQFGCDPDPEPTPTPTEKQYFAGEVKSNAYFKYGRFVVRMKPMRKSGVISSFFSYDKPATKEEIDIEFVGAEQNKIQFNYHHPSETSVSQHSNINTLLFNSDEDFHIYSFEWTNTYLAWYTDGYELFRINNGAPLEPIEELINTESIMMNIWTSTATNWCGKLDPNILPVNVIYDWVKHYSWSEITGFASTPDFEDDFNDLNKWVVTDHGTFETNNSEFVKENVIINNGYLSLWLTKRGSSPPNTSILISDDFESYQVNTFPLSGGWILKYNGAGNNYQKVIDTEHVSGSQSMQLLGKNWWAANMYKSISLYDVIFAECYVKASNSVTGQEDDRCNITFRNMGQGSWGTVYASIGLNGNTGKIYGWLGNTYWKDFSDYNVNQWYKLKMKYSSKDHYISVWINDSLVLENYTAPQSYVGYNAISLEACHGNTKYYFDDLKVWTE
ncbi:MAG: family 16 glycosylhydrolase [Bacteroidota bacterium]